MADFFGFWRLHILYLGILLRSIYQEIQKADSFERCGACMLSLTLCDPMNCSPPVFSVGFSRQEYWNALSCPPPGDLPGPGMEPVSLMSPVLAGRFKALAPPGKLTTVLLSFLRIAFSNFFVFFFYPPPPPQAVLVSYRFWSQNMQSGR